MSYAITAIAGGVTDDESIIADVLQAWDAFDDMVAEYRDCLASIIDDGRTHVAEVTVRLTEGGRTLASLTVPGL